MKILLKWFEINSFKPNPGKFQFVVTGVKTCRKKKNWCEHTLAINSKFVEASDDAILLGITTDKKTDFN